MDADGQNVRHVGPKSDAAFAAASANQDWLVYTSRADGKFRLVKVPVKGVPAIQLTDVDSISPALSHHGKSVAYIVREKGQPERLGIISIDGGTPLKTFDLPTTANTNAGIAWNKTDTGILFVNTLGPTSNFWMQPLDGTKPTALTVFKDF